MRIKSLKGRDLLKDLGINEKIILKWISHKSGIWWEGVE
jgi:hypothetical protein